MEKCIRVHEESTRMNTKEKLRQATHHSQSIVRTHTGKSFRNLIKSNRNQILYTIFQLIWNQTDVRLVPNQSENGKYNLIRGKIRPF